MGIWGAGGEEERWHAFLSPEIRARKRPRATAAANPSPLSLSLGPRASLPIPTTYITPTLPSSLVLSRTEDARLGPLSAAKLLASGVLPSAAAASAAAHAASAARLAGAVVRCI